MNNYVEYDYDFLEVYDLEDEVDDYDYRNYELVKEGGYKI